LYIACEPLLQAKQVSKVEESQLPDDIVFDMVKEDTIEQAVVYRKAMDVKHPNIVNSLFKRNSSLAAVQEPGE
jgi:hypothetical protein